MTDEPRPLPDELDEGLAFAYGEETAPPPAPSVSERIGELTGSKPKVLLRDDQAGDTPMLKPLGPDERVEAGKYVVQGELGRGGVGTVHRGHDQDLGRDVAMKFLHDKYKNEPSILHRFVEEAQIGGQLQHPGIVPVYDLGMVDGKPFFAMKLVKGQTLAKRLADRSSPADDRRSFLAIFEDVCQTLAYAHARGVVHRDLKPANIMIGSFGEVQVVDWGMGKVLRSGGVADEKLAADRQAERSVIETARSAGHGSQSVMGSVMGTPAYMPPEQARGDVEAMDERSDVFALGAILCEILTGEPPYAGAPENRIEMAALAKLDDAHARLEACDGEKEMVALATRCLMPAPAARPKTAEVVAKVVHDHLAAVEARVHEARVEAAEAKVRAASLKRAQKFGIGLTAVIAAGLLVSLWFWRAADTAAKSETTAREAAVASAKQAKENERRAVEQTEVAERELARALEIKTLITEMLESVEPAQARGADITLLKGILDTTSKRLAGGAIEDPLVAAELHAVTGDVYRSLGLFSEAEQHLPVALELRERLLGEEHMSTLGSMGGLSALYSDQGRFAEAETLLLRTLEIARRVMGEEHPTTLATMNDLAITYLDEGRLTEAETLHLQTFETRKRVLGGEHPGTLLSMGNLACVYSSQRRLAEAETLWSQTLEIQKRVLGEEHPVTLSNMANLALTYRQRGRSAEATTLSRQTLEIQKRVLGEEHPVTLSNMANLANLLEGQGLNDEAETISLQVLETSERVLGTEHRQTLGAITNLGLLYNSMERFEDAVKMLEVSLPIKRRVLGLNHPWTGIAMRGLVTAYLALGLAEEALPLQRELLGFRVAPAETEDATASVLNGAAWALLTIENESLRDPERALGFAQRACAIPEQEGQAPAWSLLDTLALAQHRTGDTAAAVETQKRALALMPEGADRELARRLSVYESALGDR